MNRGPRVVEASRIFATEQRRTIEAAGAEPVRWEDPEARSPCLFVREEPCSKVWGSPAIDHPERSLREIEESCAKR